MHFPDGVFQLLAAHSYKLSRTDTLFCLFAHMNHYFHSFIPSTIRAWNSLDESQVTAESLHVVLWHHRHVTND